MSRYVHANYAPHHRNMRPYDIPEGRRERYDSALAFWMSRDFHATLYRDRANGHERLTVGRTELDTRTGNFRDGITWDELQAVKHQCGYGDRWAVEVYPANEEVVDAVSLRHLWLLPEPPAYAWTRAREDHALAADPELARRAANLVAEGLL